MLVKAIWLLFLGAAYIRQHFSLIFLVPLSCDFFSNCKDIFLFFSRLSSSWNNSLTLWFVFAEVSIKWHPHLAASASPSDAATSLFSFSSHLLPTSIIGIDDNSLGPFVSRITCNIKLKKIKQYIKKLILIAVTF